MRAICHRPATRSAFAALRHSPRIRHHSPFIRHAPARATAGFSPDSPLSPLSGGGMAIRHVFATVRHSFAMLQPAPLLAFRRIRRFRHYPVVGWRFATYSPPFAIYSPRSSPRHYWLFAGFAAFASTWGMEPAVVNASIKAAGFCSQTTPALGGGATAATRTLGG